MEFTGASKERVKRTAAIGGSYFDSIGQTAELHLSLETAELQGSVYLEQKSWPV